jgi:hypothetical protein
MTDPIYCIHPQKALANDDRGGICFTHGDVDDTQEQRVICTECGKDVTEILAIRRYFDVERWNAGKKTGRTSDQTF